MTDPTKLEPKNGDFVAYLDKLQQESLEELRRSAGSGAASVSAPGESPSSVREMAAEVFRQIKPKTAEELPRHEPLNPQPVPRPQPSRNRSVVDEFRDAPSAGSTRTGSSGTARRKQPFLVFIGNVLMMVGVMGFVVAANEDIEVLAPPSVFLAFAGFILSAFASKRR